MKGVQSGRRVFLALAHRVFPRIVTSWGWVRWMKTKGECWLRDGTGWERYRYWQDKKGSGVFIAAKGGRVLQDHTLWIQWSSWLVCFKKALALLGCVRKSRA